jgi:hypothetical protein
MDPFEVSLWRSIAAAPLVPGARGVLADLYLERGSVWGEFMNAERFGQTTLAHELWPRARAEMAVALGSAASVDVHHAWLGLPARVSVRSDHADPALLPWAVVTEVDFAGEVRDRVGLLAKGRDAHGWPLLEGLANVSIDELWSLRPWSTGRFRSLTLPDLGAAIPAALVELLAPRPARLQLGAGVQMLFRDDLPEVWVTCPRGYFPNSLLEAVLAHGVVEGETLIWVNGLPNPELVGRLAELLPPHRHDVLREGVMRNFGGA